MEEDLLDRVQAVAPRPRQAQLAGNSVHMDKRWLEHNMPDLHDHLHYRLIDLTGLATTMLRWGLIGDRLPFQGTEHDALDDIHGAIAEYQWLRVELSAGRAAA